MILLDLRLPDMHGTDVARELRDGARTARIPVVALSARRYDGDRDRLLAGGFAGYLEKPIDVSEFPEQVRSYCEPRRRPERRVCQHPLEPPAGTVGTRATAFHSSSNLDGFGGM